MLVLTRKQNESIVIGKDIEVKILAIEDGKVKLGIEAPRDIEIYRKEIYVEIEKENVSAINQSINMDALKKMLIKK
ncbi:carbon storage regulator CsrA [Serpentinicella alkaliphila]|uniref:Translational regulator CsrA n=1 Tax=Serpentinicella alkaliphila TaxID=1734049 RepID=A0A4R2TIY4_9FIRM|nr:carbon storage regulator CsrA [Serpentinicella alkaliphila]QUH24924.1 carbon storage regulator CsrA [Serpentinicella alkaliphila]TCQ02726.1 carbon storage regulator CsrA [Serpentinicella alkaliphila]